MTLYAVRRYATDTSVFLASIHPEQAQLKSPPKRAFIQCTCSPMKPMLSAWCSLPQPGTHAICVVSLAAVGCFVFGFFLLFFWLLFLVVWCLSLPCLDRANIGCLLAFWVGVAFV